MGLQDRPKSGLAEFPPAYFSMVMATGIVSIASMMQGFLFFAHSLLWLNAALYAILWAITLVRLALYPGRFLSDLSDHMRAPGFFTMIAATCVLGSQFMLLRQSSHVAAGLLGAGWMLAFGEGLPIFRPPLDEKALGSKEVSREPGKELVLNYLTPHSKWSIHSSYSDTLIMLTLFRGGEVIWINEDDAASIDLKDNEWLECFNANGVIMAKAVVSHRIPPGKAFMYHAQERLINTPGSPLSGKRGGTHNSVTHIMMKPTHMIGGYAQLSYGFNYYGPTGSQRDEVIIVRKAREVEWYED